MSFAPGACRVTGTLYGARLEAGAAAEARHGGRSHRLPVDGEGGVFAFTVPYAPLAEGARRQPAAVAAVAAPAEDADAVRVARILDDVWDRRNVFVYPEYRGDGYRAAPCYSADNDLCVRVAP